MRVIMVYKPTYNWGAPFFAIQNSLLRGYPISTRFFTGSPVPEAKDLQRGTGPVAAAKEAFPWQHLRTSVIRETVFYMHMCIHIY